MTKKKTPEKTKAVDATRLANLAARDAAFMPSPAVWAMMDETIKLARASRFLRPDMSDAEAKLVLLKSWEVGLPSLQGLESIYYADRDDRRQLVIDTAGQKALILTKRLGVIEPVEMDSQHAVVRAIRLDHLGRREQLFSYDLALAQADGLLLRRTWASGENREGLLLARATSAAVRAMFEDAAPGLGYTAEEVEGFTRAGSGGAAKVTAPAPTTAAVETQGGGTQAVPSSTSPPPAQGNGAVVDTADVTRPLSAEEQDIVDRRKEQITRAYPGAFKAVPGIHEITPGTPPPVPETPPVPPANRPLDCQAGYTNESQPRPVRSHGISMQTMTVLMKATKEKGGSPAWRTADALLAQRLVELGIDPRLSGRVCYLTEAEGVRIRDELLGLKAPEQAPLPGTEPPPPPPPLEPPAAKGRGIAWRGAYNTFLAAIEQEGAMDRRAELEELVCAVSRVKKIEDVPDDVLADAAREVPTFVAQPHVLKTLLERARMGQPA